MSILKITQMGHPILRQVAKTVPIEEILLSETQQFLDNMIETMNDYSGIGLAAPQVFDPRQIIIVGINPFEMNQTNENPFTILFNPELTFLSETNVDDWEGCLSIPDIRGIVPRSKSIGLSGYNREGSQLTFEAHDYFARVLQHEIDHLNGILFLDRMTDLTTLSYSEEYNRYHSHGETT
ncbi:MAG: peptide deformylase [Candidatus Latescibacterota bacterium]|nr:peptide deformylase [Candidatus Latescibacterota bacterium]